MPYQPTATDIRLNKILKCFIIAVDTLEALAESFKTPFLEPISNTAKSLLAAVQTVRQNKSDCTHLLEQTYALLSAIISFHMEPEAGEDLTLYKIHTFVEAQQDKSKIRHFFRQGEMSKLFKDCNTGLLEVLALFKVYNMNFLNKIVDMQKFAEDRHQEVLELINAFSDGTTSDTGSLVLSKLRFNKISKKLILFSSSSNSVSMLPSEPKIFYGCEAEVSDILKLLMLEMPRITLLGAACDSTLTKDDLVAPIGVHLGLKPKKDLAKPIEIRRDFEEFLALLTDVQHLTLIDAARQIFIDIADDVHDSDDIDKVLLLTGNMPLAIGLMAHLVDSEDIELVQSELSIKDVLSCKAALLSTSLVYNDDQRRFKALVPTREYVQKIYPPAGHLVQPLLNYFQELLKFDYTYYGTVSGSEITLRITSNFLNIQSLLLNRLQHQNPVAVDTIYCIIYLSAFSRLAGRGRTPLMDHIMHPDSQPLSSHLEVYLITEIFSSWHYYPVPNPEALVDKAIKQLPHFNESDIKSTNYYQTGLSLAISTGNTRRQGQLLKDLAYIKWQTGDQAAGLMHASEAQRLAKMSGDLHKEAQALESEATCWHALGNFKHAASLCNRARDLLAHCGMSGCDLDNVILANQAEIHNLKSEYTEAQDIQRRILHESPITLGPSDHAFALLNIAELGVLLGTPMDQVQRDIDTAKSIFNSIQFSVYALSCDAVMGALYLRERNLLLAKSLFNECLSFLWGKRADIVNFCLGRLGDGSLWDSTDWSSSWTIVYLVHASKSKYRLDVHKALQFLGDIFRAAGDQGTAISLLTLALEGFTQTDVHQSRAECMLQLGDISKENGDLLKALELWRTARSLFERSSQAKKLARVDEGFLSIPEDVLDIHRGSLTCLSENHAPGAALETTTRRLEESDNVEINKITVYSGVCG
ncbi:hypothetical protein DFH09DRAFT_1078411 [Mycena vulgaris]|nr:hypothetical protein DFH09DRAFT_1078411 [Mycena vulgaris]